MDGMERMLQKLLGDAQEQADTILKQARTEAEAVSARYAARAEEEKTQLLEKGARQAEEQEKRLNGLARMEVKKDLLAAKQEMLSRAFAQAAEELTKLPEQEYGDLLVHLARRACVTGRESLLFSPKDREKWGETVVSTVNEAQKAQGQPGQVTLSAETRPLSGGLIVQDEDGEMDCSLDALAALHRSELTPAVSALLFGEEQRGDSGGKVSRQ